MLYRFLFKLDKNNLTSGENFSVTSLLTAPTATIFTKLAAAQQHYVETTYPTKNFTQIGENMWKEREEIYLRLYVLPSLRRFSRNSQLLEFYCKASPHRKS